MSQQIENQIVKMQFDNASFEKNVQQSMSTLDKLKAALKFNNVDMTPLQNELNSVNMDKVSNACDAVTKKFSFFGTVVDQVVRDMTTKVANAAEKMVKSFTIDQVASGWEKYAQKTTAVQTIMANTIGEVGEGLKWADQAEQMEAVTKEIEKLNWFTDETSYSLTDMTDNIGKFVAQKVPLEQATRAMMGISTWAAISGQTKTQAGMAMYNLSQSLGQGAVKAIDWKSIENANMATSEFKETVIETAKALGVLDKETGVINEDFITAAKYNGPDYVDVKNFRDTLSAGWFNSDVLMTSLEKYGGFSEKINELYSVVNREGMVSTTSGLLKVLELLKNGSADADKEITRLAKNASMEVDDLKILFSELAGEEYDLGRRAFAAAQEAKTFQEAIDATSDAVASEWMGIFEAIFGNYLEAKELWTDLANSLWDIFAGPLDNIKWALIEWKDAEVEVFDANEGVYKKMRGRELLLDAVSTAIRNIGDAIEIVRAALAEVFPIFNLFVTEGEDAFDTSEGANGFMAFTKALKDFADSLKLSEDAAESLSTVVHVLATAVKIAFDTVGGFFEGIFKLVGPIFNIADAIFGLIGKIISAITGNDSVIGFADKLNEGAGKVKSGYLAIMDKVAAVLNKIADAIRGIPDLGIAEKIGSGFRSARDSIVDFWEAFKEMPVVQQMVEDFNKAVSDIEKKVTPVIDKVKKGFDDFKKKADSAFSWKTINDILTKAYDKFKKLITVIKDFSTRIKDFFRDLRSGKSIVDSFRDNFSNIIDKVNELKENLSNFFRDIFAKGDEIGQRFDLASIQTAIHDFVTNITPDQITMIAVAGTFMLIAINMLRLSEALRNAVEAFTGIGVALKNVINSYIKKQKSTILQVAEAIVIVAASLWVLSTIPQDKLQAALGAIITLTGLLAGLVVVLTLAGVAMNYWGGKKSMVELASGLVLAAGAFMVAALSLKVLEYVNLDGVLPKIGALALIMVGLVGLSALMSKVDKFGKGSLTMIAISASLLIAAEALAKVGSIPKEVIENSIDAMMKIMLGLAALTFASSKVGVFSAVGLIAIVLTLDKILPMIEKIVNYDYSKIKEGLKQNEDIVKKLGLIVGAMVIIGAIAGNRLKGAGIAMLSIAAVFAAMLGIAKLASMMKPSELAKGETFLWHMAGIIALLELCSKNSTLGVLGGKNGGEGTKAFTRIAVAMGILLGVAKLASLMEWKDLAKGEAALLGLTGIILAMTLVANKAQKSEGVIRSVATMIFAVSLILAEVALLSMIPLENMSPALGAILSIILALGVLAAAISSGTKVFDKATQMKASSAAAIIVSMIMVGVLGGVLVALSKEPTDGVKSAAMGMIAVIASVALFIKALGSVKGDFSKAQAQSFVGSLLMVAAVAAILTGLTYFMKTLNLDPDAMIKGALAVSVVLLALTPVLLALNTFQTGSAYYKKMGVAIAGAIGSLIVAAAAIGLLSRFGGDGNKMIQSAIALAITLAAICAPIAVLGALSKFITGTGGIKKMWNVVAEAITVLAGVSAALWFLSNFGNQETMIQSAQALAIVLFAISVPIAVLAAVGQFCRKAKVGVMWSAVGGAVVALGAIVGILIWFANSIDQQAINMLNSAIPILITAIAGVGLLALAISAAGLIAGGQVGIVGAGFVAVIAAIASLAIIIAAIAGLGYALNNIKSLQGALESGLDMLVVIAGKIGEAIGAFIGGIAEGISEKLITIAENLTTFSEKLIPFAENIETISDDAVRGAKNLAAAMLYLTAAEFLDGVARFIGIGKLDEFDFGPLGVAIAGFCDAVKDVPSDSISKASVCSAIALRLSEITSTFESKGGLAGLIFGEKESLEKFGEGIRSFAVGIVSFITVAKNLPEDAAEIAQRAADAAEPMVNFANMLIADGGLLQAIIGHKDLGEFGVKLTEFVAGLLSFVANLVALEAITPDYATLIQNCADAMTPMLDLARGIENTGGLLASIVGDDDLGTFGNTLGSFVDGMRNFIVKMSRLSKTVPDYKQLIIDSTYAAARLIELANMLENMGGVGSWFSGDNTLDKFGNTLAGFGDGMAAYAKSLAGTDLALISAANTAVTDLVHLGALASGVRSDSFSGLKLALEEISTLPVSTIANEIIVGTPLLVENVDAMFTAMLTAMNTRLPNDQLEYFNYGNELIFAIRQGIMRNMAFIYQTLGTMVNGIKTYLGSAMAESVFFVYGKNVSVGIQNGIHEYSKYAVQEAKKMAEAINEIIPEKWKEKSPSRVAYGYGKYYSQGLALGIGDYAYQAVESTSEMADDIVSSANTIIAAITNVIDSDMDTQPTIRPVLDTTELSKQARNVGQMFNSSDLSLVHSVSGSINDMVETRNTANAKSASDAQNEAVSQQINFTQNNYSPKALSRYEIYRDTKNQISMMKGVIANA